MIAKLDRLSRNAAFLLTLRDSGVRFAAVDLPEANDLTVGIMALVAQAEREAISRRTKEALAVARSRGVRLGNPNGAAALRRAGKGGAPLRAAIARNADRHAQDLAPVVADIRSGGATSLRAIAAELNARGMLTRRGGRWHVSTVTNLLDRLEVRTAHRESFTIGVLRIAQAGTHSGAATTSSPEPGGLRCLQRRRPMHTGRVP